MPHSRQDLEIDIRRLQDMMEFTMRSIKCQRPATQGLVSADGRQQTIHTDLFDLYMAHMRAKAAAHKNSLTIDPQPEVTDGPLR
jgi:hypothetical protein